MSSRIYLTPDTLCMEGGEDVAHVAKRLGFPTIGWPLAALWKPQGAKIDGSTIRLSLECRGCCAHGDIELEDGAIATTVPPFPHADGCKVAALAERLNAATTEAARLRVVADYQTLIAALDALEFEEPQGRPS